MARRPDPQRIYEAGRAAIRNWLLSSGMSDETADSWLASWEIEAATRQLPTTADFWTIGDAWIAEQRAKTKPAPRVYWTTDLYSAPDRSAASW